MALYNSATDYVNDIPNVICHARTREIGEYSRLPNENYAVPLS